MSKKLPHKEENCCLSADEDYQMYAVGSRSHTDLLDSRSLQVMIVSNRRLRMHTASLKSKWVSVKVLRKGALNIEMGR